MILRYSQFINEQGTAVAQAPPKQAQAPAPAPAKVQLSNSEKQEPGTASRSTSASLVSSVPDRMPELKNLEKKALAIIQKRKKGNTGQQQQNQQQQTNQQQRRGENVSSVRLEKNISFTIQDNAFTYHFNYIGADRHALVPYYSFSKEGEKSQYIYVPKQNYDTIGPALQKLASISQMKPNLFKDDTIVSAMKANLTSIQNDATPVGENQVKLGGIAKDVWVSLKNFAEWGIIKDNAPYSEVKNILNKVKSEENNIWMIKHNGPGNYKFNEEIKIGDKIKLVDYNAASKKWVISSGTIIVKAIIINKKEENTF